MYPCMWLTLFCLGTEGNEGGVPPTLLFVLREEMKDRKGVADLVSLIYLYTTVGRGRNSLRLKERNLRIGT